MRRFIKSLSGRVVSQVVAVALALPSITFALASRSEAQLTTVPGSAVLEFQVKDKKGGAALGQVVANALNTELGKFPQKYDMQPKTTVDRNMTDLSLQAPLTNKVQMLRLGQAMGVSSLFTGSVEAWRVVQSGATKKAEVIISVMQVDMASGLAINGSNVRSASSVRPGDVSDDVLLAEASAAAASDAVRMIMAQSLPSATVLNTGVNTALLNRGARDGFKDGQEVIVFRNREQVATGTIIDVQPDASEMRLSTSSKGLAPGDKVQAIFTPPKTVAVWTNQEGEIVAAKPRASSNLSGVLVLVLLLVLGFLLFGQGRGSNQDMAHDVTAEPGIDVAGTPGVLVTWTADIFARGNSTVVQWEIYRDDQPTPVRVTLPGQQSAFDGAALPVQYSQITTFGGTTCDFTDAQFISPVPTSVPPVLGRPTAYSVSLIYRLSSLDLPGGGSGSNGGNNGGGNANGGNANGGNANGGNANGGNANGGNANGGNANGGNANGGNANGGNANGGNANGGNANGGNANGGNANGGANGGSTACFFRAVPVPANGAATALARPVALSPVNVSVSGIQNFSYTSVVNPQFPIVVEYVLQVSTNPNFTDALSVGTVLGSTSIQANTDLFFAGVRDIYWRIGAKNTSDIPGPIASVGGQRYVFSAPAKFSRPLPPPSPAKRIGG